ncbi:WD40 repeat domain-containing protein [Herbidospora cretacea]|uniref:WD40 repeat domain-containing protein n=1 Tax=Herbidospora cretacea TaxID=28444 RepID=UPI000B1C1F70|nr:WD40 repeat domain-containing protein [Herbidospora cretacea]
MLRDAVTGTEILRIAQPSFPTRVAFDTDGTRLATCCRGGEVQVWRLWPEKDHFGAAPTA